MANPDRQGQSDYRRTEQEVANKGFDETFKVPATELLAYNSGTNTLDRVQINDSGQILTNATLTGSGGGSTSASLYIGQVTVSTSAVQISGTSHALTNGVIIKAPSTNSAAIYVGLTGVIATTGDMIEPGEARGYAVSNLNLLYIVSAASTTDTVTYSGN